MKTIKITAFKKTYEGKNNTDDINEYEVFEEIEFSKNLAPYLQGKIGDWERTLEIDHYEVEELESGVYKASEQYDKGQLHLLFNY